MADPPTYPDSRERTGTPRWVKVFGVIGIVLVLLVAVMMFIGSGSHGPGRHTSPGDAGGITPASSVTELGGSGGHAPPAGGH